MANTATVPAVSRRDAVQNRIRGKHADKQFADDEAYYGQIDDDYNDYESQIADRDKQIEGYKQREGAFSNMFTKDPRSATYLQRWRDGEDPAIALVREFGDDIRAVLDDPERQDEIAAANKEYAQRVAEETGYEEEYNKNLNESLSYLEELASKGRSDEEIDGAMEFLWNIVRDGIMGKFSPESIELAMKAKGYDAAVANAGEEGEVRGRNAKIEEKLARKHSGDGHAPLGNESGMRQEPAPRRDLGPLDKFSATDDIWTRGGEKRTRK